jgi:hypothetical protein
MPLTLSQFLFLVLTLAAVVGVVFLVMFLLQMRRTAAEASKTLAEFRELAKNLQVLEASVREKVDEAGQLLEASKRTVQSVSQAAWVMSSGAARPAAKLWPVIWPLARYLWRHWKKRREVKNDGK